MNAGIGKDKTVPEHRQWANQLYAVYARGREARLMAAIVGESGLAEPDRRAMVFAQRFETKFVGRADAAGRSSRRSPKGWRLLETLPREDLPRICAATWASRTGDRTE